MLKKLAITLICLLLLASLSLADVINVPADYETIQAGINASDNGDTVLVDPGEYVENINFVGHIIVLGSLFLTTGNQEYITETVINGDRLKSVVTFENGEGDECEIVGFTIQNGESDRGGGLNINESNPTISWLIVSENIGGRYGGGMYLRQSQSEINHCTFTGNQSNRYGGGLYSNASDLRINDCVFTNNVADNNGGGLLIVGGTTEINRCLIANNDAERSGGIRFNGNGTLSNCTIVNNSLGGATYGLTVYMDIRIVNCIISSNDIYITAECIIEYSTIENGLEGVNDQDDDLNWGEGNIEEDPLFADAENADYHLTEDSPCIDAGDPNGDADPNGTRADMGSLPLMQGMLMFEGFVIENSSGEPLEAAQIATSYGDTTFSDSSGFWQFSPARFGEFEVTASIAGYIDSTIGEIELELDDTLDVVIRLLHPEISPTIEAYSDELMIGENYETLFTIENTGDGVLDLSTRVRLRGDSGNEIGTIRQSIQVSAELNDNSINGVIFSEGKYYLSGKNNSNPLIYILDQDGALESSFEQPFNDDQGLHDLAWDGELIWGGIDDSIYSINLDGEIVNRFELNNERGFSRNIAYDSENDWIWVSESRSDIYACTRDGDVQAVIDLDGRRTYGLAYWEDDPDGFQLYLIVRLINNVNGYISKVNIETAETRFVANFSPVMGTPRGAFVWSGIDDYSVVIMSISDIPAEDGGDRIDIWQMHSKIGWLTIDPLEGVLSPNDELDFFLGFDATDLMPIHYPAEIIFSHNAIGGETIIPIDLTVIEPNSIIDDKSLIVYEYAFSNVYPNPFNGSVRLSYDVPLSSQISIKIYDIEGRYVDEIANRFHNKGQHSVVWNAMEMPSGIYFAKMEARGFSHVVKLMLMK